MFAHKVVPIGDYVVEMGGHVVATGGYFTHYNAPYADLYMEVRPDRRGRGIGAFLVQEVKEACYLAGRIPAARCPISNLASRATLLKAGFRECGFLVGGGIAPRVPSRAAPRPRVTRR
jgi:GNAT superfamily N-acetyltransferase